MELRENEIIDDLEFQGLKIIQNKNWFKFGIDSVLISDFAKNMKKNSIVLDIGTGTGIIPILLSKKTESKKIFGIEIQKEVAEVAKRNVKLNKLEDKIEIINDNIKNVEKHFENNDIDCIITNPPYQKANSGLENENRNKLISRHEIECTLEDILQKSYKVLKNKGEFYMVHRTERLVDVLFFMRKNKIEPKEIKFVYSKISEKPNLFLVKGVKNARSFLKVLEPLIVYDKDGKYTNEILKIYNKI